MFLFAKIESRQNDLMISTTMADDFYPFSQNNKKREKYLLERMNTSPNKTSIVWTNMDRQ